MQCIEKKQVCLRRPSCSSAYLTQLRSRFYSICKPCTDFVGIGRQFLEAFCLNGLSSAPLVQVVTLAAVQFAFLVPVMLQTPYTLLAQSRADLFVALGRWLTYVIAILPPLRLLAPSKAALALVNVQLLMLINSIVTQLSRCSSKPPDASARTSWPPSTRSWRACAPPPAACAAAADAAPGRSPPWPPPASRRPPPPPRGASMGGPGARGPSPRGGGDGGGGGGGLLLVQRHVQAEAVRGQGAPSGGGSGPAAACVAAGPRGGNSQAEASARGGAGAPCAPAEVVIEVASHSVCGIEEEDDHHHPAGREPKKCAAAAHDESRQGVVIGVPSDWHSSR